MSGIADTKAAVFFGELLMRLGTKGFQRILQANEFDVVYTGAEANCAVSLANYGLNAFVVSAVPETDIGQACINYIRQFGVNTDHVKRCGKRLGTFYLETGASQRPSRVIYDRAGSSITELKPGDLRWKEILAGKDWFHFAGTAPALGDSMPDVVEEACRIAKDHGLTVSCDLNYRSNLWSTEQAATAMSRLMEYVDVLCGNEEDAEKVFGIRARDTDVTSGKMDEAGYVDVATELSSRFNLKYVAITLRESISASDNNWSAMLYDQKNSYFSRKYAVHLVDRVGGGDAFSGALIYGLLTGMASQEAIDFAAAASCLKQTIPGDINLVGYDEVMALVKGDASGRVRR